MKKQKFDGNLIVLGSGMLLVALLKQPLYTSVLLMVFGCLAVALEKSKDEDHADRYWKARTKSTEALERQREDRQKTEELKREKLQLKIEEQRLKNEALRRKLNK